MKVARTVRRGADGKVPVILRENARQLAGSLPYLILVAIVVAAVGLWYSLGAQLAAKLAEVVGSF